VSHVLDRRLIYASAGLRATAVGLSGVIVALYLAALHLDIGSIGIAISLGLAGCAVGTLIVTLVADRMGRRATLAILAFLMALGGLALAFTTRVSLVMLSVLLGMVNGMGRDRGAGLTVEQAMLPQTTTANRRTSVFAWYNLTIDGGHAIGALLGGLPAFLRGYGGMSALVSYRWTWVVYCVLCGMAGILALRISPSVERRSITPAHFLSPASRPRVMKFALLSGLDSLGGGFLTTALLGFWFFKRFGVDESLLGPLFFTVRVANGLSHLGAAWIAKRIGLVKTMVFTHLPSSLLLMLVPCAPTLSLAIIMFLIRESLVEMDVPTRQSYIVAIVEEEERTKAAGITNLTRSAAWAIGPFMAGSLMRFLSLSAPLIVGPALKIAYDVLLYRAFHDVKPPEERAAHSSVVTAT